jgi:hypothetical protein
LISKRAALNKTFEAGVKENDETKKKVEKVGTNCITRTFKFYKYGTMKQPEGLYDYNRQCSQNTCYNFVQ